jgi:transposase
VPRASPFIIHLRPEQAQALEARARKYTSSYRDVVRAKIVLLAAQGLSNDQIAGRLDLPRQVVSKWRKRFFEEGFGGLQDRPRGGRPAGFSPSRGGGGEGLGV